MERRSMMEIQYIRKVEGKKMMMMKNIQTKIHHMLYLIKMQFHTGVT